jgi:hypothetical protein
MGEERKDVEYEGRCLRPSGECGWRYAAHNGGDVVHVAGIHAWNFGHSVEVLERVSTSKVVGTVRFLG